MRYRAIKNEFDQERASATDKAGPSPPSTSTEPTGVVARVCARLAGSVFIPAGVDIVAPTGVLWDAQND
jgi:hypothetical protein